MTVVEEKEVSENERPKEGIDNYLSPDEVQEIRARGYEIGPKLGEGNEKIVYAVDYMQGRVKKTRVMEVPRLETPTASVTTEINRGRGCGTRSEIVASNSIQHPNVVEILDSVDFGDRTINFTEYHEGSVDLETLVNRGGALRDEERLRSIIKQSIAGMKAMHDKGYVHRDIKPSNILITGQGIVKIGDLSTAKKQWDILYNSVPTRGGTAYAHPRLLNALLTDERTAASYETDRYSLGATILFLLTGQAPTDYATVRTEKGREIELDQKQLAKVAIWSGRKNLLEVDGQEHDARLRAVVKSVPKEFREYAEFAYRCMTEKKGYATDEQMQEASENIGKGFWNRLKDGTAKGIKYILPSVAAAGVVGLVAWGIATRDPELKPTLSEILRNEDYSKFNLEARLGNSADREWILDILVPRMEEAQKKMSGMSEEDTRNIRNFAEFGRNIHCLDQRLTTSWLRACYLLREEGSKGYEREKEDRLAPSFVPKNFAIRNQSYRYVETNFDDRAAVAQGIMYLKQCIGHDRDVSEVFADYFSSREDINTARVRTHSTDFLPRINKDCTIEVGYSLYLPGHEQRLTEMATALYLITDEKGNIDYSKIPVRTHADGTFRNMRHLPEGNP